ncbi:hypothetical protein E2C01_075406 [Portunus trituberculatus]|uniref:Uncharacterized protein n=1 Tax=Portunus trituberculatus TaxID=210409 RepID=A0A5B7IEW6_PORTR|nr:hypothetical protein [Portunus trituberculatus]
MWVTEAEKALEQALANTIDLTASTTTASSATSSSTPNSVATPRSNSRSVGGQETPGKGGRPGSRGEVLQCCCGLGCEGNEELT